MKILLDEEKLCSTLEDGINLFLEYMHDHGQSEDDAKNSAIVEILQSFDDNSETEGIKNESATGKYNWT